MQLSDKIKKFSVGQAIDYLNRNPVKNLPKLLVWADTFCAGKFEGQRRAISAGRQRRLARQAAAAAKKK